MALTKIDDIYLYAGITAGAAESFAIKQYLVDNNVKYTLMFYGDDGSHEGVFAALSTWFADRGTENPFTDFPILVYTEIHDDLSPSQYPRKYFTNLNDITNSNFLSLV